MADVPALQGAHTWAAPVTPVSTPGRANCGPSGR